MEPTGSTMGLHMRLTAAVLVPLLGFGCAGQRREVRLHADGAPPAVHVPDSGGQPIEIPEAELWGAFREAGRHVVAQDDPLAAAEQTFGLAELSGTGLPARAIGSVMAVNPVPILIGCHRVVAGDGLGGYSGGPPGQGPETKRWLLEHEGILPPRLL